MIFHLLRVIIVDSGNKNLLLLFVREINGLLIDMSQAYIAKIVFKKNK